jgi:hypothetical protein
MTGLLESYDKLRRLEDQLRTLRVRLEATRRYLGTAGSNISLGEARLERLRGRYSATLAAMRLARREAHRRLGLSAPADHQNVA